MNQEQVREQVQESRKAQGLPEHVPAGPVLDQLAAEVLAEEVSIDAAA
jgi:hypothetical protein